MMRVNITFMALAILTYLMSFGLAATSSNIAALSDLATSFQDLESHNILNTTGHILYQSPVQHTTDTAADGIVGIAVCMGENFMNGCQGSGSNSNVCITVLNCPDGCTSHIESIYLLPQVTCYFYNEQWCVGDTLILYEPAGMLPPPFKDNIKSWLCQHT
jgi:hypothetical protein